MRGKNEITAQSSFRIHKNLRQCCISLNMLAIKSYHLVLTAIVAIKKRKHRIISSSEQDLEEL